MSHYTPKFQAAYDRCLAILKETGDERAFKTAFRDAMLELGHEERIRNLYRVNDKLTSSAQFFRPNAPQEHYLQVKKGRDVILKCRQIGFTTLSGIRGLDKVLWEANSRCGIMAHINLTVGTIFNDIVKYSYEWFKRDWGEIYAPVEKSANTTELAFEEDGLGRPLDSSMRVLYDFRGKTVNFLHVSEASRVEDARLLGSLQGVPVNGEVILESTPQGRAGSFYNSWKSWRANGLTAPYKGHFIPWFTFYPETPETWQEAEDVEYTPYEQGLMDTYGLTPAHVLWRRWCIEANCNGSSEQFENEYPSNDIDCFYTGDASVYPSSLLKGQDRNTKAPLKVGFLIAADKKMELHEDLKGLVSVWELPDPSHSYVVGADPSGGVGKDRGAAYVKDRQTKRIVARIWGDIEPAEFANELYKIGMYYNKAWICVESNNHGHTVLHVLKEKQYSNLYKRAVLDEFTQKPTRKVGFLTTNDNKLRITELLKVSCQNGKLIITDAELINEMTSFVQVASKTGRSVRREASPNAHDDLVMAACLMEEMDSSRADVDTTTERTYAEAIRSSGFDPITGFSQ